jgi:hypothetical protein
MKSMQVAIAFAGGLLAVAGSVTQNTKPIMEGPRVVEGASETIPPPPTGFEEPVVEESKTVIELGPALTRTQIWRLPDGTLVEGPTLEDPGYNQWAKVYVQPLQKSMSSQCNRADGSCPKIQSPVTTNRRTLRVR